MSDITPERIEELRRLAEEATPGPWALIAKGGPQGNYFSIWNPEKGWIILDRVLNLYGEGDRVATYIAAANPATMLALLDALEEARREHAECDIVAENWEEWGRSWERDYHKACDERDQLRAENERLRAALEDIAYNTSSSVPPNSWPSDHYHWMMQRCVSIASNTLFALAASDADDEGDRE